VAAAGERLHPGEAARAEQLAPALRDGLALRRVRGEAAGRGQELVPAHPDEGTDALVGDGVPRLLEGLHPGPGVGVVAVHEGPIHVEDDAPIPHSVTLARAREARRARAIILFTRP